MRIFVETAFETFGTLGKTGVLGVSDVGISSPITKNNNRTEIQGTIDPKIAKKKIKRAIKILSNVDEDSDEEEIEIEINEDDENDEIIERLIDEHSYKRIF